MVDGRWWVTGPASCHSEVNSEEDSAGGSLEAPQQDWALEAHGGEPAFTGFSLPCPWLQSLTFAPWGHLPGNHLPSVLVLGSAFRESLNKTPGFVISSLSDLG